MNNDLAENLQSRIEKRLKQNKDLKTTVESKNREIGDLEKASKVKADVCNNLRKELNEMKTKFRCTTSRDVA